MDEKSLTSSFFWLPCLADDFPPKLSHCIPVNGFWSTFEVL